MIPLRSEHQGYGPVGIVGRGTAHSEGGLSTNLSTTWRAPRPTGGDLGPILSRCSPMPSATGSSAAHFGSWPGPVYRRRMEHDLDLLVQTTEARAQTVWQRQLVQALSSGTGSARKTTCLLLLSSTRIAIWPASLIDTGLSAKSTTVEPKRDAPMEMRQSL